MEDIRIGRKSYAAAKLVVSPANVLTQICGPNPKRIGLFVSGNGNSNTGFGPDGMAISDTAGFIVNLSQVQVQFDLANVGQLIQVPWNCFTGVPGATIAVIEIFLDES